MGVISFPFLEEEKPHHVAVRATDSMQKIFLGAPVDSNATKMETIQTENGR